MKSRTLIYGVACIAAALGLLPMMTKLLGSAPVEAPQILFPLIHILLGCALVFKMKMVRWLAIGLWLFLGIPGVISSCLMLRYSLPQDLMLGVYAGLLIALAFLVCAIVLLTPAAGRYFQAPKQA